MTKEVIKLITEAKKDNDGSLNQMIEELENLGDKGDGNSNEYKLLKEGLALLTKGNAELGLKPEMKTIILKCN